MRIGSSYINNVVRRESFGNSSFLFGFLWINVRIEGEYNFKFFQAIGEDTVLQPLGGQVY
jgi:hypothetical protein